MKTAYPEKLYKYLSSKYEHSVLAKGELLFRNLTYFRQTEGKTRGDYLEAHHRDNPDNDVTITSLATGKGTSGDFSFLNSTDSDLVYVFCLSHEYKVASYDEFDCDICIEIQNPAEFIRRTRLAVMRRLSTRSHGLLADSIRYYEPNKPSESNIKNARILPFLKDNIYLNQNEYRMAFGVRDAFKLKQQIISNKGYNFRAEANKGTAKAKIITIGAIDDIISVHRRL